MDTIQQAVRLSMEHLDLFSDRAAHAPDSKGARAVTALEALVQHLGGTQQVHMLCTPAIWPWLSHDRAKACFMEVNSVLCFSS